MHYSGIVSMGLIVQITISTFMSVCLPVCLSLAFKALWLLNQPYEYEVTLREQKPTLEMLPAS